MTCALCAGPIPPRRQAEYAELERIGGAGLKVTWVRRAAYRAVRERRA